MLKKLGLIFVCISLQAGEKVQLTFGVYNCTSERKWYEVKSQQGDQQLYSLILKGNDAGLKGIKSEDAAFAVSHARNFGCFINNHSVTGGLRKKDFAIAGVTGAALGSLTDKFKLTDGKTSLLVGAVGALVGGAEQYRRRSKAVQEYQTAQEKYKVDHIRSNDATKEIIYEVNSQVLQEARSWTEYRKATSDLEFILSFADTKPDWISTVAGSVQYNHWNNFRTKHREIVKSVHPANG